jgi:hypothetical protein
VLVAYGDVGEILEAYQKDNRLMAPSHVFDRSETLAVRDGQEVS